MPNEDSGTYSVILFFIVVAAVFGIGYYYAEYAPCPEGKHVQRVVTEINRNTGEVVESKRMCVDDCMVPTGADYKEWMAAHDCVNMTWVGK